MARSVAAVGAMPLAFLASRIYGGAPMRTVSAGGFWVLVFLPAACVNGPDLRGPLPTRNQQPAQLLVMHMDPANASVLPSGGVEARTDFAYTSLFLMGTSPGGRWVMDGEYLRATVGARVGLGAGLELQTQVAAAHTSGGFLDSFVIDYHDALGLPDQDRSTNPRDQFAIEARDGGQVAWAVEERDAALMDLPILLTWQVVEPGPDRLGVALRGGVELPVGDQDRGYGNGEFDASVGAVLDYRVAGIGLYGHVQHSFAGTPDQAKRVGVSFRDVTSAGIGAELPLDDGLNAFVQVEWETSTLREIDLAMLQREQLNLWFGGRLQVDRAWAVEVGFGEDLVGKASPDFTAWLGVVWRP